MTKEEAAYLSDILKAYSEGKQIEHLRTDGVWDTICDDPTFSEGPMNYRIKPEPKYRPYKNAEKFLKAQKEHGMYIVCKGLPNILYLPTCITDRLVVFQQLSDNVAVTENYKSLCVNYTLQDGSPCGILEE